MRSRVLVMLRLRMSSSLTTLLISFWLSSSTMSIFHCAQVVSRGRGAKAQLSYIAARRLLDRVENDCVSC
jgi:hypothetical protein